MAFGPISAEYRRYRSFHRFPRAFRLLHSQAAFGIALSVAGELSLAIRMRV